MSCLLTETSSISVSSHLLDCSDISSRVLLRLLLIVVHVGVVVVLLLLLLLIVLLVNRSVVLLLLLLLLRVRLRNRSSLKSLRKGRTTLILILLLLVVVVVVEVESLRHLLLLSRSGTVVAAVVLVVTLERTLTDVAGDGSHGVIVVVEEESVGGLGSSALDRLAGLGVETDRDVSVGGADAGDEAVLLLKAVLVGEVLGDVGGEHGLDSEGLEEVLAVGAGARGVVLVGVGRALLGDDGRGTEVLRHLVGRGLVHHRALIVVVEGGDELGGLLLLHLLHLLLRIVMRDGLGGHFVRRGKLLV